MAKKTKKKKTQIHLTETTAQALFEAISDKFQEQHDDLRAMVVRGVKNMHVSSALEDLSAANHYDNMVGEYGSLDELLGKDYELVIANEEAPAPVAPAPAKKSPKKT